MFKEGMSGSELLAEYNADLPEIKAQTIKFDGSEWVSGYLGERVGKPRVVITKIFTATGGNRYLGILIYDSIGEGRQRQWKFSSFHFGLMEAARGQFVIAFFNESRQAMRFTPHFFHRYRERFMGVCDWKTRGELLASRSDLEIASVYMKRNLSITWIETRAEFRNKVHIFGPVNDGVVLLQYDKERKLLQANTFITEGMLSRKQSLMVEYARTYLSLPKSVRRTFSLPNFVSDN